ANGGVATLDGGSTDPGTDHRRKFGNLPGRRCRAICWARTPPLAVTALADGAAGLVDEATGVGCPKENAAEAARTQSSRTTKRIMIGSSVSPRRNLQCAACRWASQMFPV